MAPSRGETWHWQNLHKVKEQHSDQACAVWSVYIWTCTQLTTTEDNINMHNVTPVQLLQQLQTQYWLLSISGCHPRDSSTPLIWIKWAGLASDAPPCSWSFVRCLLRSKCPTRDGFCSATSGWRRCYCGGTMTIPGSNNGPATVTTTPLPERGVNGS